MLRQRSLKEILMKTVLLVAGGLLCTCALHANAQATGANPTTGVQTSADNSEGPDISGNSMSGAPATLHGKTREDVYQDLVRSQKNGEAVRLQELFKGS
jgi:biotin carboxylase